MKKALSVILALLMLFNVCLLPVVAAGTTATIHAGDAFAQPNSTVLVPLYINNAASLKNIGDGTIGGLQIRLEYDSNQLTLTGFIGAGITQGYDCTGAEISNTDGAGKILAFYPNGEDRGKAISVGMIHDNLLGYIEFETGASLTDAEVSMKLENITDSAKGETGNAISYNNYIAIENFTVTADESAFAGKAHLYADDAVASPGYTVSVPLYLNNAAALKALGDGTIGGVQLHLTYDTKQLTLIGFDGDGIFEEYDCSGAEIANAPGSGKILCFYPNTTNIGNAITSDMTGDTLLGYIQFQTKEKLTDAPVAIEVQNICDSAKGETGKAVNYRSNIQVTNFTISAGDAPIVTGKATIHAEDVLTKAGSSVSVPLYLNNAAALKALGDGTIGGVDLRLYYDANQLKLTGFTTEGITQGFEAMGAELADTVGAAAIHAYVTSGSGYAITNDMTGDTLIGYAHFQTTSSLDDAQVDIEFKGGIVDSTGASYNDSIEIEGFTISDVGAPIVSGEATLFANDTIAQPDSTVSVPLYLNNAAVLQPVEGNDGTLGGFQIRLVYEDDQLTLTGFEGGGMLEDWDCTGAEIPDAGGAGRLLFFYPYTESRGIEITDDMTGDLLLGYMQFATSYDFTFSAVSLEVEIITDSGKGDTGGAVIYNDFIQVRDFEIKVDEEVENVIELIDALGTITSLDQKADVEAARTAYDALSNAQQEWVTNLSTLVDAEAAIEALLAEAEANAKAAAAVDRLIDALGTITSLDQKVNVVLVRNEYENLTDEQKALVTKLDVLEAAEATIAALENASAADKKAAADVDAKIDELGEITSLEQKADVEAARKAYDDLTDTQKLMVTKLDTLTLAEDAIAELEAAAEADAKAAADIDAKIAALGEITSLDQKANVEAARKAYDDLTDTQKAMVTKLSVLTIAEDKIAALEAAAVADAKAAADVDAKITALGEITSLDQKADVEAARAAYDDLTDAQKAMVTKLSVLTLAEDKIAELEAEAEADVKAAADVDAKIAALGTITSLEQKADVEAARAAYDSLTDAQKSLVTKLDSLNAAEVMIKALEVVAAVEALIEKLNEVNSLEQEADVEAAREAYESLTDEQKKMVTKLDTLVKAEETIEELKNPYTLGDVDKSGKIDVADIMKIKTLIMLGQWSDEELSLGDMDTNTKLDVADIMGIKKVIMSI